MPIDPADFTVVWEPARRGIQWVSITHAPSGKSFRLKAAKCVTDGWLASGDPAQARNQWLRDQATAFLERRLYEESPDGIREALIAEAKRHRQAVLHAQQFCERLKVEYPAHAARIPTITVTGGED